MGHGQLRRAIEHIPPGPLFNPGLFGRMFPNLRPLVADVAALEALGEAMREASPGNSSGDNSNIPAGFTYLGQFIDHDITFDTTPLPEATIDPLGVHNFRTPKLDLDCLYGAGPTAHPFMYERSDPARFVIGKTRPTPLEDQTTIIPEQVHDLPRSADGFALIGDPRNDENLIVAQLHLAFLKFHNKVLVDVVRGGRPAAAGDFEECRRIVTWHYQWIVLHDFLRRLIEPAALEDVLTNGRRFYHFGRDAFIPVEFAVAAYRLGHSMVRQEYDYNRVFNPSPSHIAPATFDLLFGFTGLSGPNQGLFQMPVPSNWIIDWRRFFDLDRPPVTAPNSPRLNHARRLDPFVAPQLFMLPPQSDGEQRLPVRNLKRGLWVGLPSGQAVAAVMRLPVLTPDQIARGPDGAVARQHGFDRRTPLWYYILKEAEVRHRGRRLGPVGSRILAEVFVGILEGDSRSFLSQSPDWTPTLPSAPAEDFAMVDLLSFLGPAEINPLGDP